MIDLHTYRAHFLVLFALLAMFGWADEGPLDALGASNATEGRLDVDLVDAVYSRWVTETKSVEGALEGLERVASDEGRPALERSKSRLSQAHLHWQYGDREKALERVETALELAETVDGTLLKARLLDASGDESGAAEWYRRALDATELSEEREFIRIRLAMIGVDRRNVEGLLELARDRDQEFRNRAAITLAVLGHPDRALELYRPDAESPRHFRQLVRVAEWALKAGDHATAREHAWRAYDATDLRFDALYALTLVDEAYRGEGRMDDLVRELEARGVENEDLLDLRIDLLIDLERYDDAIDLFHAINRDTSDVEARMRLIQIYDTAGKSSEMVSEYENLIEREPTVVQWYVGLASYHINVAEPERALEVWERFEESNRDRIEVLVLGGEFMNQMGYVAEATAMVERHAASHGPSVYGNVFLFETHFARGRESEAELAVEELWASLPPDSSDLRVVADSFERLRKFERALDVFEAIREHEGRLGYDDRMRLAWLHNVVGNQEVALELWREIWVAEEAPARRSFAESQLLQIAAELNALADMAVDLEAKLYSGEADRNEMNLLVRIYTEVGDAFSATEIVQEFARSTDMPEVEKLRQLGLVYLQLQEYSKYDEVLRRLEQIDPESRLEHIQNIVLNLLAYDLAEGTSDRYEDIQHWLEELRRYDAEAVSGEFEASVLSMGGFSDEAIESYRRALIEQPEHSDNLLLMADLMKEDDRTMEAVALLQYVAEHAEDDNEFVVAVDGIINMVGQRMFFQQLGAEVEAVFRWTHRVILERITGREDKFYLYTLLSEIAQETNDREGEFTAMENSVSEAGIRRLAVLREIVTMATPNAGFFTIYRNEGDPERQLTYGRRLIGLRQQLPPEVYISIARTLLSQGDTVGAERSLSLVRDITGQIDVVKTKADLFLEAGYSKQALASYSQALTVNRDSLELQFKTAALREGNGQLEVANALYANALDKVMRGLPAALHAAPPKSETRMGMGMPMMVYMAPGSRVDTSVTREFRTFYDILVQGLISTWPESKDDADVRLNEIRSLFDEELVKVVEILEQEASVKSEEEVDAPSLARFSRLDHVAQLLRRLCIATGNTDLSDEVDLILVEHFSEDEDFVANMQSHYSATGTLPEPTLVEKLPDLEIETIPYDQTRLEAALDQAIEDKDIERVSRISNILETPEPLDRLFRDYMNEGNYRAGLRYASVVFDDSSYMRLVNVAVPHLKENRKDLMQFLYDDPHFMIELEDFLDDRLFPINEEFLRDTDVRESLRQNYYRIASVWHYAKERGGIEELVLLFEHFVENLRENQVSIGMDISQVYQDFFSSPLDLSHQQRVKDATSELLSKMDLQDEYVRQNVQAAVCIFDIHEANTDIFLEMLADFESAVRGSEQIVKVVREYHNGNVEESYQAILDLYASAANTSFRFYLRDPLFTAFKAQYLKSIDDILEGKIDDVELAKVLVEQSPYFYNGIDPDFQEVLSKRQDLYEALNKKFPEEKYFIQQMVWSNLRSPRVLDLLEDYYNIEKENDDIRMAYYLSALNFENYDLALSMALDGRSDLRREDVREEIFEQNDAPVTGQRDMSADILRNVRGVTANFGSQDFLPAGLEAIFSRLQEIANSKDIDIDEVPNLLRLLWRGAQAAGLGDSMRRFYGSSSVQPMLIQYPSQGKPSSNVMYMSSSMGFSVRTVIGPGGYIISQSHSEDEAEEPTLLEVLMSKAPLGRELERFLVALSPWERQSSIPMYEQVSKAYQVFPDEMSRRLAELSTKVVEQRADDHEFVMWLILSIDAEVQLTDAETDAVVARARRTTESNSSRLQNIARLLAKSDRFDEAVDCYEMLVLNQIRYREFSSQSRNVIVYGMPRNTPSNVLSLVEDASEHLPVESAQALVRRVIPLVRPFDSDEEIQDVWKAFVVRVLSLVHTPSDAIGEAEQIDQDITQIAEEIEVYDALKLVQIIRVHYLDKKYEESRRYLEHLFRPASAGDPSQSASSISFGPRYVMSAAEQKYASIETMARVLGLNQQQLYRYSRISSTLEQPPVGADMFLHEMEDIVDFEDSDAIDSLVRLFRNWLGDSSISQIAVFRGLTQIAGIFKEREELEQARNVVALIQDWLLELSDEELQSDQLRAFQAIASDVEFVVDSRVVRISLERDMLSQDRKVELIKSLRAVSEPSVTLEIAKLANTDRAGLSLLLEIRSVAEEAMDSEYAESLDTRILRLENAYESIKVAGGLIEEEEEEDSS